jgi:hypothetical protein
LVADFFLCSPWITRKNEDGSYVLHAPGFKAEGVEEPPVEITWVAHDMGLAAVALIKNYETRASEVVGQTFFLCYRTTFPKYVRVLSEGMPKIHIFFFLWDTYTYISEPPANGKDIKFSTEGQMSKAFTDMVDSVPRRSGMLIITYLFSSSIKPLLERGVSGQLLTRAWSLSASSLALSKSSRLRMPSRNSLREKIEMKDVAIVWICKSYLDFNWCILCCILLPRNNQILEHKCICGCKKNQFENREHQVYYL